MKEPLTKREIQDWLINRISSFTQMEPNSVDIHTSFNEYGLSSIELVMMSGDLEEFIGTRLKPTLGYEYPTIDSLAEHLSKGISADRPPGTSAMSADEPIAIVGMGCRFPGANGLDAFWNILKNGEDKITEVSPDRWDKDTYYHPDPSVPGKSVSYWGGFVDDIDQFDPFFFGISPKEAKDMDPQQRLLMELSYEALDDAGLSKEEIAGSDTGVFIGISVNEYSHFQLDDPMSVSNLSGTGSALSIAANRISYFYDLHGPSLAIDTACSSSLSALHMACKSIRSGEINLALVGGVNLILSPVHSIAFTKAGVLAPDGRCKTFDASANGYVRGEGGGMVVLKPLSQAMAQGDNIYAVVRGSIMSQDGRTNGLMAPNQLSQVRMLEDVYQNAGIDPANVQYIEAHGTGTVLGDSIEVSAIGAIIGKKHGANKCHVGSVKTNIGHLEAAAGMAGLIKVALSIKNKSLPPSLHFKTPNQHIEFDALNIEVQDRFSPWPSPNAQLIAGVSSFGFGGSNVHVILSEVEHENSIQAIHPSDSAGAAMILPLSARSQEDLLIEVHKLKDHMASETGEALKHVCHALGKRRSSSKFRLAVIGHSKVNMMEALDGFVNGEQHPDVFTGIQANRPPKIVFVFSGQGGQWLGMGRKLIETEPAFYEAIKELNYYTQELYDWSVVNSLMASSSDEQTEQIDKVQPTIFAVQVALVHLLRSRGVDADAVVGHSMGEVAAAYSAGVLTLEDAVKVICSRSALLTKLEGKGCMMVTELSVEEAREELIGYEDHIAIAAINGPNSTVLSGDPEKMNEIMAKLEAKDLYCKRVKVTVASHSPQIDELREEMLETLKGIFPSAPSIPMYSTVTGSNAKTGAFDEEYWFENLRAPVLFTDAIRSLVEDHHSVFIEIGPHPLLLGSIQQSTVDSNDRLSLLPTLKREEDEAEMILRTIASLYVEGVSLEWDKLYGKINPYAKLPPVSWHHDRYWIDQKKPARSHWRKDETAQPLLGNRINVSFSPNTVLWQNVISTEVFNFLIDHKINDEIVFPAAGYIETAFECLKEMGLSESHVLSNFMFVEGLILQEGFDTVVQIVLSNDNDAYRLQFFSQKANTDTWTLHATANLEKDSDGLNNLSSEESHRSMFAVNDSMDASQFYAALSERGLNYGPSFSGVKSIQLEAGRIAGRVELSEALYFQYDHYSFHPALLDACLQVIAGADINAGNSDSYLPFSCGKISLLAQPDTSVWTEVTIRQNDHSTTDSLRVDIAIFNPNGQLVAKLHELDLRRIRKVKSSELFKDDIWFYRTSWEQQSPKPPLSSPTIDSRNWLIFADDEGYGENLKIRLEARGDRCEILYAHEALDLVHQAGDKALSGLIERSVAACDPKLFGIVHLWSLSISPWMGTNNTEEQLYDLGCISVIHLVNALSKHFKGSPGLWMITKGAQSLDAEQGISVEQSTVWGLCKVISFEIPELKCVRIDLDSASSIEQSVSLLESELSSDRKEDQITFHEGQRFVHRLLPYSFRTSYGATDRTIQGDSTYLITGGLGGLGLETAKWLASKGAEHLVLMGRSEPSAAARKLIDVLTNRGVQVVVAQADVSKKTEVSDLFGKLANTMPPLKGIIHAAGILDDGPIYDLDEKQLRTVMRPKVEGSWNLHENSLGLDLDFFILFSSAVSVLGSPGQGNYSAASSYQDALAAYRQNVNLPAMSINWGPWAEVGLAFEASERMNEQHISTEHLVKMIDVEQGFEVLDLLLQQSNVQVTVLPFDLKNLLELYPPAAAMPFFKEVGRSDSHVARLYARPNLKQEFVAPRNEIEHKMAELWQQTLHIDKVGIRDSFFELGGDSVLAAQILSTTRKTYGIHLDPKDAFQYFTIERIAEIIETEIMKKIESMSEEEVQNYLSNEE